MNTNEGTSHSKQMLCHDKRKNHDPVACHLTSDVSAVDRRGCCGATPRDWAKIGRRLSENKGIGR